MVRLEGRASTEEHTLLRRPARRPGPRPHRAPPPRAWASRSSAACCTTSATSQRAAGDPPESPARWTDAEFVVDRSVIRATAAAHCSRSSAASRRPSAALVSDHHGRLDGGGYPRGLTYCDQIEHRDAHPRRRRRLRRAGLGPRLPRRLDPGARLRAARAGVARVRPTRLVVAALQALWSAASFLAWTGRQRIPGPRAKRVPAPRAWSNPAVLRVAAVAGDLGRFCWVTHGWEL